MFLSASVCVSVRCGVYGQSKQQPNNKQTMTTAWSEDWKREEKRRYEIFSQKQNKKKKSDAFSCKKAATKSAAHEAELKLDHWNQATCNHPSAEML